MSAAVKWIPGEVEVPVGYCPPTRERPVETGRHWALSHVPDPDNGLIVTQNTEGRGWRVSHRSSGYAIGMTAFPLIAAKKLCLAIGAVADWKQPIENLWAERDDLFPKVSAAAQPFIDLAIAEGGVASDPTEDSEQGKKIQQMIDARDPDHGSKA